MTTDEKIEELACRITPDTLTEPVLRSLIRRAERMVLSRRYPFGYEEGTAVPPQYEDVQIDIAVELYSKIGAEGQTSHTEAGVSRDWENGTVSESLLKQIIPLVGTVRITATEE